MQEPLEHNGEVRPFLLVSTDDKVSDVSTTQFCIPIARIGKCRKEAYNPEMGARLWDFCYNAVKDFL